MNIIYNIILLLFINDLLENFYFQTLLKYNIMRRINELYKNIEKLKNKCLCIYLVFHINFNSLF